MKRKRALPIRFGPLCVILAALTCWGLPSYSDTAPVDIGSEAPEFTVNTIDGEAITLSGLKGKVVLLNFFATWCAPCRSELRHVQSEIWDRFRGDNFAIVAVGRGHASAELEEFRDELGLTFPVASDPDEKIFAKYAQRGIPRNYIIDKSGEIVYQSIGYSEFEFLKLHRKLAELFDRSDILEELPRLAETIELIAVGKRGDAGIAWWAPNGSPLATPPPGVYGANTKRSDGSGVEYEFVFDAHSSDPPAYRFDFPGTVAAQHDHGAPVDDNGNRIRHLLWLSGLLRNDHAETIDIQVSVETHRGIVVNHQEKRTRPYQFKGGGVIFHEPFTRENSLVLMCSYTDLSPHRQPFFVAYDTTGEMHGQSRSTSAKADGFVSVVMTFNGLTPTTLDRIEMHMRSFELSLLREVSLASGARTEFRAEFD